MKKILIATAVFPPEPVVSASLSYDIAMRLYEMGHKVVVLSPRPSRPLNYNFQRVNNNFCFEHVTLDSFICPESKLWGRFKESYSFGKAIKKYIENHYQDIDFIYANVWPLFSQWFLARTAKKIGISYCIHVQDIYPESYSEKAPSIVGFLINSLFMPLDKYILGNATKVIAISPASAEYLSKTRYIEKSKILVARNWQNDEKFAKGYQHIDPLPHKKKFMYLGSINPTANVEFLIRAFSHLREESIILSIIGNGSNKENCRKLARELNVDVEFGEVTPDKVPQKQAEADVLILSLKEGVARTATPSKLTAYLYSGRPVIACVDDDSDCANIIREAKCGYVVPPNDEDSLRKAVGFMIKYSHDELNIMGISGVEYAKLELSRKENLNKITNFIIAVR